MGNSFHILVLIIVLRVATMAMFKSAAINMDSFSVLNIITNYLYLICIIVMLLRAFLWHSVLTDTPLSTAHLFTASVYPSFLVLGFFFFDEEISSFNVLGALLIFFGVLIIVFPRSVSDINVS